MKSLINVLILSLIVVLSSCKKDKDNNNSTYGTYKLHLTDTPGEFNHVYLDIQTVEIMQEGVGWITSSTFVAGTYDILSFKNGLDTLIVNQSLATTGKIIQIRLKLGSNNTIVKNGIEYVLIIPSAIQSGIKINTSTNLVENGTIEEWIDLNIGKSIKELPNNVYKLNPVFRTYNASTYSKLNGYLFPQEALGYVTAVSSNDTVFAIPNSDGFYQFSGLQGNYMITFIPTIGQYVQNEYGNVFINSNNTVHLPDYSF